MASMELPLLEDAEAPATAAASKSDSFRSKLLEISPIAVALVVLVAVVIGFVARDVSVATEMRSMEAKLLELQSQMEQAKRSSDSASASNAAAASLFSSNQIRTLIPSLCKLDCMNSGVPNANCSSCEKCAAGYGGRWCHVPASCASQCDGDIRKCLCRHGGELNLATCSCECPPGWAGFRCLNAASVTNQTDPLQFLAHLAERSRVQAEVHEQNIRKRFAEQASDSMLSTHLGVGVDGVSRETKLPVIQMTMPAEADRAANRVVSPRTGRSYIVPSRVTFSSSPDTTPSLRAEVFSSFADYTGWIKQVRQSGSPIPGAAIVRQLADMSKLFSSYGNSFISLTQMTVNMFKVTLNPGAGGSYETFQLEDNCARALDYLPSNYDSSSKDMYNTFLDYWGDSFAVEVNQGGLVESVHAVHKAVCKAIPAGAGMFSYLSDQQKNFMGKFFGLNGIASIPHFTTDGSYESNAAADSAGCSGGDPLQCVNILQNKQDLSPWINSVWDIPTAVTIQTRPITDMIRDPTKKAAMQAAIDARVAARTQNLNVIGRDPNPCPAQFLDRPERWHPVFGLLRCLFPESGCWDAQSPHFKLCSIKGYIPREDFFVLGCTLHDGTKKDYIVPAFAICGYEGCKR